MNPVAVRSRAIGALCFLGAADLLFLNLWVFPRAFGPQRLAAPPVPSLSVARVPRAEIAPPPAAAQETPPAPAPRPPVPVPGDNVVAIRKAYFDRGKWAPRDASAKELATVVALAARRPKTWIFVDGHADPTGPAAFNDWLSTQRATAVAERLIAGGADRARVVVRHFGASRPVADGAGAGSFRRNRRVELLIVDGSAAPEAAGQGKGKGDE